MFRNPFIFLLLILLLACKAKEESIQMHEDVTSRLKVYESDPFFAETFNDSVQIDYISLSYEDYKKKYGLKRSDMNLLAQSSELTIAILKANRDLEKFEKLRREIKEIPRIDTSILNSKNSFNKIVPIKFIDASDSLNRVIDSTFIEEVKISSDTLN